MSRPRIRQYVGARKTAGSVYEARDELLRGARASPGREHEIGTWRVWAYDAIREQQTSDKQFGICMSHSAIEGRETGQTEHGG